jgi:hypothetical protein
LKRSRVGGSSGDNTSVVHSLFCVQHSDNIGDGRSLLTDGSIDAVKLLVSIILIEVLLLINNSINSNCSLSSLSITNDELTLSTTNRYESIDTLKTSLHGLVH